MLIASGGHNASNWCFHTANEPTPSADARLVKSGGRAPVRRVIPPWELRHLRAWGYARRGAGLVLTTCSLLTLSFCGHDAKTYGWAAAFVALAGLNFAGGFWELMIASLGVLPRLTRTSPPTAQGSELGGACLPSRRGPPISGR